MAVDQYALTSLANVKEWMSLDDDDVREEGLAIYVSSTDATAATVQVTDTTLVVVITGGADAGTTTKTFSDSTDDTLGELVTTLNAVSGIVATLLGPSDRASGDLIRMAATNCLLQANEQVLVYQGNALLEALIDRMSDKIETFCDRQFVSREYREWHDGRRHESLLLEHWPVTSVERVAYGRANALTVQGSTSSDVRATVEVQDSQIVLTRHDSSGTEAQTTVTFASNVLTSDLVTTIDGTTGWSATLQATILSADLCRLGGQDALGRDVQIEYADESDVEYTLDEARGELRLLSYGSFDRGFSRGMETERGWPRGFNQILVQYTGGYATVPDDLEQICIELVAQAYRGRAKDLNLRSESIGSYSYTLADQVNIEGDLAAALRYWKELR